MQYATSYYLVNTYTTEANIVDTEYYTIKYIDAFINTFYSYPEYPIIHLHITSYLKMEAHTPTAVADTESAPNASSPTNPLSNST